MKHIEMCLRLLAVLAIITTSCTGGSDEAAPDPTAGATATSESAEEPTASPTVTATPEPVVVTDQDRIDAAMAALEAEPGAGMIAFDVIDTSINDRNVTITVCGWTGDTVFDDVYDALYETTAGTDGTVAARELSTALAEGECLNTELIDSAIETINEFEAYWSDITRNPESFIDDQRSGKLLTTELAETAEGLASGWVRDDIYFDGLRLGGVSNDALAAPVLYRRSESDGQEILEFGFCRDMDPNHGAYRDGVLVDDYREPSLPGLHVVDAYLLAPGEIRARWEMAATDTLIWTDCFGTGDWPAAASEWRTASAPFAVLPS